MKTILITGASSGIGRALAVQAARAGYAVYAVGRNLRALGALGAQIGAEGGIIATDVTDVSEPANAPGLIGRCVGTYGRIDVLVNNAGAVAAGPIAQQSDEDLRAQFGTHVVGPLALTREALPALRASQGHVFMLGSGVARVPVGGLGAYPPSKAALRSATTILRRELTPIDICVTYVDPGAVDTAFMTRAGMPGAPQNVLVSPDIVARKILLAITTRPRVVNVAPLQSAAVAIAELLPAVTEAILERNPTLVGAGPALALEFARDADGRGEKIALPSAKLLANPIGESAAGEPAIEETAPVESTDIAAPQAAPETHDMPAPIEDDVVEDDAVEDDADDDDIAAADDGDSEPLAATVTEERSGDADAAPAPPSRWKFEPPEPQGGAETEALQIVEPANGIAADPVATTDGATALTSSFGDEDVFPAVTDHEPHDHHDLEPAATTSSFDAALEALQRRMERANLDAAFVRGLLVPDAVIDVGEAAMRWAGMPNKHERALTSEVFFALAEWGFLAPRADGRYRVLRAADEAPKI